VRATVPSGLSQVTVPVALVVICPVFMAITSTDVQSYRTRDSTPLETAKIAPVVCVVAVIAVGAPGGPVVSNLLEWTRAGSPRIVTFCERQSLNSVRDVVVNEPTEEPSINGGEENVVTTVPPPGHEKLKAGGEAMDGVKADPETAVWDSACPTAAVTVA